MKRYIRTNTQDTSFLDAIDSQIRDYLGDSLISVTPASRLGFGRGGNVYMFKVNDHNVYRVFVDPDHDEMIFQCIAEAFYVDGTECYDEAVDYKDVQGHREQWFDLFKKWIDECEADDPKFTNYEYDE